MMPRPPHAPGQRRPRPIRIETERWLLRTLVPADASERWCGWVADPEVMGPVNTPPRTMSRAELAAYIARFDQETRLLIGIFDRANGLHVGFYQIDVSPTHRTAAFNVIVGDKSYWGRKVVLETRAALLDHLFRGGVEKATGAPLARNFPAVFNYKAQGWRLEGILKGQCRPMYNGPRLDQYQFGLLKDEWIAMRKKAAP
ncbi:MAG: GNAT family protein [Alphaproteobacteria bacterium]|jgi:RimJ/RimL family protein N-acetyltransferase